MTNVVYAAAAAVAVLLGGGTAAVTTMQSGIEEVTIPDLPYAPSTALDGRSFYIEAEIVGWDGTETDELMFRDGHFISLDCQEACDFGWTGYEAWEDGDTIHFTVTTNCSEAPHEVVWVGSVTGDTISADMVWTTRRWYWRHQIVGTGGGPEIEAPEATPPPLAVNG